ncbi:hypothetical protein [Luteimonas deserti]|uniref:Uncharacterized protein n=1 Tax=Luteimonas deserti TaxID=2752306 RepID=A0A7Z0QS58_9GAMM|nr:hypothetical protein [Luteimonas deserti]NYZ63882.1 hypothetical protein [Luteimonas deserti]
MNFDDDLGTGHHVYHDAPDGALRFDHDGPAYVARRFDNVATCLDAPMPSKLAEVHDDAPAGERLLGQRHDDAVVRRWRC